jgi:hypothetical protein
MDDKALEESLRLIPSVFLVRFTKPGEQNILFESDIKPLRNVYIFSRPSFENGFLVFLPDIVTVADDTVSLPWHEEHKSLVVYNVVRLAWSRIWYTGTSQGRGLNS